MTDAVERVELEPCIDPSIEAGTVAMLCRDNAKMREAGCNLAEAAARVVRDYDGLHRLSIAISAWFSAIANEGDRDERHTASADTRPTMTGLCERLLAKIAEQRERRGNIMDYGEPDDELVEALARIEALEAALREARIYVDGCFGDLDRSLSSRIDALLSDSPQ